MQQGVSHKQWLEKLHAMAYEIQAACSLSTEDAYRVVEMAVAWRLLAEEGLPVQGNTWPARWAQAERRAGAFFYPAAEWPVDQVWEKALCPLVADEIPCSIELLLTVIHQQSLDSPGHAERGGRRARGSFYTPGEIVERLLAASLDRWIQHWRERWQVADRLEQARLVDELTQLRVLDPACGAGAFLLVAWERLIPLWTAAAADYPARSALLNIYGYDQDAEALNLLRLLVTIRLLRRGEPPGVEPNLVVGDFLVDTDRIQGTVDLVVGNPPWVRAKYAWGDLSSGDKRRRLDELRRHYRELAQGELNLYTLFISHSLDCLGPTGQLALIVPNSFLLDRNSCGLRQRIVKDFAVTLLTHLDEQTCRKSFGGITQAAVLLVLARPGDDRDGLTSQIWWRRLPHCLMASGSDEELGLLERLLAVPRLGEQYGVHDGEVHLTKHRAFVATSPVGDDPRPLIRGCDLKAYGLKDGVTGNYLLVGADGAAIKRVDDARLLCQRIANQHMSHRLKAALVERVAAANSTLSLVPQTELATTMLQGTLVLLHSELYNWLLKMLSSDNNIPAWKLKLFPWLPPVGLHPGQDPIESNRQIYRLFGIRPEEQAIIERRLRR